LSTLVPRFFFHFSDGKRQFSDGVGSELRGIAAARVHAISQVRALKAAMSHTQIPDLADWTMTVADLRGETGFEIGFDLRPLPVRGEI
jgi:hypothetical protein